MTLTPAGVPPSTAAAIARQRALAQYVNTVIAANDQGGRGAAEGEPPANGILDIDQDYVNPDPEGQFHIYSNQDELLEKVSLWRQQFSVSGQPAFSIFHRCLITSDIYTCTLCVEKPV